MLTRLTIPIALILAIVLATASLPSRMSPISRDTSAAVSTISLPIITAETAIVVDDGTRQIVYAKAPRRRLAPASLTKMMTAIVAVEKGNLKDTVKTDVDSEELVAETESSVMGLMPGDELTLEQLLYGLLLPSGNDAAIAIARHIAGSESRFVVMMNQKAKEIGLADTHFANPHGLDAEDHYSTVYDMAIIARYAMQDPTIATIVNTRRTKVKASEDREIDLFNSNPLLGKYRGADGVKPGFTDEAQQAIAGTAQRNGRRLYVVAIRSNDMVGDATKLFDYHFALPVLISPRTTVLYPLGGKLKK